MHDAQKLVPAQDLAATNKAHYPNESAAYRTARNELIVEEIELRRHLERVASQRRALPAGGKIPQDFLLASETDPVPMAEDRDKCLAAGCSGYLSKPIDEDTLLRTVQEQLGTDHSPLPNHNHEAGLGGPPPPTDIRSSAHKSDSSSIKSSYAGNPRIMAIIPDFVGGLPGTVRKVSDFLKREDLPELQKLAHQTLNRRLSKLEARLAPAVERDDDG